VRRRAAFTAALMSVVIAAAGCTDDPPKPAPPPGDSDTPITWQDCRSDARKRAEEVLAKLPSGVDFECGSVRVPQDWADPGNGETFDIAVMRAVKGSPDDKVTVLTNPGGPGGSGLDHLARSAEDYLTLLDHANVASFDPRGVGSSNPVECFTDADLDANYAYDPDPVSQASFDGNVAVARRMAEGCGDKYGEDLSLFSTEQAARDLDAIRAAVGDDKLTYFGYSYGTLLGAVYAELFPAKVRAMVLDGAVDPAQNAIQASEGQAIGFERALNNYTAWCKANATKCEISADPKGAISAAIDRARTDPVKDAKGRAATSGIVMWAVITALYDQETWKYIGQALELLRRGDPELTFLLADAYAERDDNGQYGNQTDANSAVNCADGDYPTVDEIRALQSQWRTKYPMFGPPLATGLLVCSVWPAKKDPYPVGPATGAPPIVVVGSIGDPATPYESTQKLADMLGVGQVVTYEGEGHAQGYTDSSCIRRAVNNYLIDVVVPADGLRCKPS
jgi:pimeloyl-ACP methyl ester carboxylesterase